jgi:hypothetical protein
MKTSLQGVYDSVLSEEALKGFANSISTLADAFNGLIEGAGGFSKILLPALGMIASKFMPALVMGGFNFAQSLKETFTWSNRNKQNYIEEA